MAEPAVPTAAAPVRTAAAPATMAPPAARPVPTAAPAPSCGPPEISPLAMPGPKMPRANSASAASTMDIASSMVGWFVPKPVVNCAKSVEPMPTMTASTSTFTPEETTLPSTRSARKAVLPNSPKGTSTKPASVVSLNSISVMKSWIARMKKDSRTTAQANIRTAIWTKFVKNEM